MPAPHLPLQLAVFLVLGSGIAAAAAPPEADRVLPRATTQSLLQQLDELRQQRRDGYSAPVTVTLPAGDYPLAKPLQLDAELVGNGLRLQAAAGKRVVISGAQPHLGRRDVGACRYALSKPVVEQIQSDGGLNLIVIDGKLHRPAMHPNLGYHRIERATEDRRSGIFVDPEQLPENFAIGDHPATLVFYHDWSTSQLPIRKVDHQAGKIETIGPIGCSAPHYAIDHFEAHPRYQLEGHRAFADQPGEWYVDLADQSLVLLWEKKADPPRIEIPRLERLLIARGSDEAPLKNLTLAGLTFTGTRFPMPAGGIATAQATMHEPRDAKGRRTTRNRPMLSAAVEISIAENCEVVDCQFEALGNTALWLGSRTQECLIRNCKLKQIGGNGINLGEDHARQVDTRVWYQSAPDQVPTKNRVVDCDISQCGQRMFGAVAIWAALQRELEIAGNHIHDCPYTGVSLGWIWNDASTPAGKNVVRDNHIHDCMGVLSDGGGIYTLGRQPESRLVDNRIENIAVNLGRAESNGMFLDQGSTGFLIEGNRFRRIEKSPLRFHQAGQNKAVNNHWEPADENTPFVRYNNTPTENITLENNLKLEREPRIYLIGNSLTWDTRPMLLDGFVRWHIDCGKSLCQIAQRPQTPCVDSSHIWPEALPRMQYDWLCVQPHYGTSLKQDVQQIAEWLELQPEAKLLVHTGWPFHEQQQAEWNEDSTVRMTHNEAYFDRLLADLRTRFPDRQIVCSDAHRFIERIRQDIEADRAPLGQLAELYRDKIHLTSAGRYLMHNRIRQRIGQPLRNEPIDKRPIPSELKKYLDGLLRTVR